MTSFPRAEVEQAWQHFVAVGDSGDWNAWADLHSDDGLWVEHHLGTFRGREEIRKGILEVMSQAPAMEFPVDWHTIDGNRVIFYPWQVFPDPRGQGGRPTRSEPQASAGAPSPGQDGVYRFGCVTVLEYAGDGLWSFQEDLYNPREAEQVMKRWVGDGGKLPARRG